MPAQRYPIVIEQGATFTLPITYFQDEIQTVPVDLSGYTARVQIRKAVDTQAALYTGVSTGGSPHITLNSVGEIKWEIPATITETLAAPFNGVYYFEIKDSTGKVTRLL